MIAIPANLPRGASNDSPAEAEPYFDLPPGPELARRNRRRAAEQEGWPDGALGACEMLDERYPGWSPGYRHVHWAYGGEEPAGYYARSPHHKHMEPFAYGATPEDLAAAIQSWCWEPPA